MLTLTPSAVEAVDALLHDGSAPDDAGLRISATDQAQLTAEIAPAPAPGDQVIEESGARVFVDPAAAQMLDNAQLEAHTEGDHVAFGLAPRDGQDSMDGSQP